MRLSQVFPGALAAAVVCLLHGSVAQGAQAFVSPGSIDPAIASTPAPLPTPATAAETPKADAYADGTRAVNESRWADAVQSFSAAAEQHGEKADGALYWKAYAQDKLGQVTQAEETCASLRSSFPTSKWIDDCGALEVQIAARTGKRVQIEPGQSDDVKLLALNTMLRQDEPRALAAIQAILSGDSSEHLKKEAQFILGQHYSNVTYGQIVRVSHVEGDVRVQRGEPLGKSSGDTWEQAVVNLPLETGFSLVTGTGRAEIELENASTLYLGENSVLTFNDLEETAGVPFTEIALLSGSVTLHIRPYVAGERFILHTPTTDFNARYPDKSYARIDAYTDAVAITPLEGKDFHLPGVPKDEIQVGRTWTYRQGQLWAEEDPGQDKAPSAFDQWVSERVTKRDADIASVMEASGLTMPIPGMAEMAGQGTFFDCAPYGTCWEPNDVASEEDSASRRPAPQLYANGKPHLVLASFDPSRAFSQLPAQTQNVVEREIDFPCMPTALRYRMTKDPVTGKEIFLDQMPIPDRAYSWGVCHAGTWVRHKRHYVWCVGTKRHHITPVRWVKSGKQVGFVPLHPYDVKGQPAINARHQVFIVSGKPGNIQLHAVRFEPNLPIEYMKEAPKEFRNEMMRPLALAQVPHMEARALDRAPGSKTISKAGEIAKAGVPIHFDAKSHTFTVPHEAIAHGGHPTTVFAPMTNHSGSLQARGESFSGSGSHGGFSGGFHGSSAGGFHGNASSGGSHGASSGAGGGSHSSGGSSSASSGGGSHSSGGSSSSSSSGSSSSSSGGSHH